LRSEVNNKGMGKQPARLMICITSGCGVTYFILPINSPKFLKISY